MRTPRTLAALVAAMSAFVLASAPEARADAPDASARADALFARGKADMTAGRYVTACAAFSESLALEPAEGTLLALALCHEKEGELVRAWNELRDVASRTERDDRRRVARAAVARVEPRIGRVVVTVARDAPACAASIRIDDRPVTANEAAHEIAVSTGDHRLGCDRATGAPFATTFVATAGGVAAVSIPAPEPAAAAPPPAPPAHAVAPVLVGEAPSPPRVSSTPVLGLVLGGAGIAALGAGAFFGVRAMNEWKTVEAKCDPAACHDASAAADAKTARADATLANVGIVAGAVLVGAGLVLVLTHPSAPEKAVAHALAGGGRVAF